MAKTRVPNNTPLHKFTIRIDPDLAARFDAYAMALGKTYQQLLEPVLARTLDEMKLTADQQTLVKAHMRVHRARAT